MRPRCRLVIALRSPCLCARLAAVGLLLGTLVSLAAATTDPVDELIIFAAASTAESVRAVAKAYAAEHQVRVTCSCGSSSTLAKQIEQGAPADVFLSADEPWMDYLERRNGIVATSRVLLLGNELVLIAPSGKPVSVTCDTSFRFAEAFAGRLAIGDPIHVPAGIYAKEALTNLGWWEALSGRLAPTADVRAALKLVELGETDLGVVYATDAQASATVTVVARIPAHMHTAIRYPLALTSSAKPHAAAFAAYLQAPAAQAIFAKAGFTIPAAIVAPPKKPQSTP